MPRDDPREAPPCGADIVSGGRRRRVEREQAHRAGWRRMLTLSFGSRAWRRRGLGSCRASLRGGRSVHRVAPT
eukprot:2529716-Prymnesium_polylepis.1